MDEIPETPKSARGTSNKVAKTSYWTVRRRIRKDVESFLLGNESMVNSRSIGNVVGEHSSSVEGDEIVTPEDFEMCPSEIVPSTGDFEIEQSSSDSGSDDDESVHRPSDEHLKSQLVQWVTQFNIPLNAVTGLLKILQPLHPDIPTDARSLLRTPRSHNIIELEGGGQYVHLGIHRGIAGLHESGHLGDLDTVQLQFSIDGLPLYKSSSISLWPILCLVKNSTCVQEPFVVGTFCGNSKPSNIEAFLSNFVEEMKVLLEHGIHLHDSHYNVALHSFVCDAPARALLKNVKGHNAYFGCEKCETEGDWHGRVTFQETDSQRRTNLRFDEMANEEHHLGPSALKPLSIGMVTQFPLDYMHLVCLGVMRRLLLCWLKGPLKTRLCGRKVQQLSCSLISFAKHMPREFSRLPRTVSEVMRWKATEFRQFLFYTGPTILLSILPPELYQNFLLLSVGVSLLANPSLCAEYCEYANGLLETFVKNVGILYGKEMLVYNVHSLIHLADDVQNYGAIDNFSAFPFENALGGLKKLIRKPNNILQQLVSRLSEKSTSCNTKFEMKHVFVVKKEHTMGPIPQLYCALKQYRSLQLRSFFISIKQGDNCILTTGGKACLVRNILSNGSACFIVVEEFSLSYNFFEYPLPSRQLNILQVEGLTGLYETVKIEEIAYKFVCLPSDSVGSFVLVPLIHLHQQ